MTSSAPRIDSRPVAFALATSVARASRLPRSSQHEGRLRSTAAGFTLAEVLIASTLSAFVLAAVMSSFVFLGRTGFRTAGLSELEAEVRRGLETFAQEARLARDVRWNNAQSVTLLLPSGSPASMVTYGYDADAHSATHRAFYRVVGDADSAAPRRALIRDLADDFTFKRYRLETASGTTNVAANDIETKQLQIVLRAQRTAGTSAATDQSITSSRYILRNKRVSN
jgi:Tfp pilus assembly protein PilW